MDDLQQLATLLAKPEPSGDVIGRGRRELIDAIHAPARRRLGRWAGVRRPGMARPGVGRRYPAGWLACGAGLTAAAAAAAAVVATGLLTPGGTVPSGTHPVPTGTAPTQPAVAPSPAQKVLLAAAATVLRQHEGTYWHFKIKMNLNGPKPPPGWHVINTDEGWIARDGKYWNAQPRCAAPAGTAVFEGPGLGGFRLGNIVLTYQVTRRLPTNPAALAAWFAKYNPDGKYGVSFVADALIALQWQVPTPPRVRAAAFQALAAMPGVTSLGPVKGGVGLLITFPHEPDSWIRLVIDPATSLVRSEGNLKGVTIIQKAQWTNRLPRVIPLPPKYACGR